MPTNTAAWELSEKEKPLKVQPAEYTRPGPKEIVVKNAALGLNPVDFARQLLGNDLFPWVTYPTVYGSDVAGEVAEVGADVTGFKPGDRVLALGLGLTSNRAADAAFQEYTVVPAALAARIPASLAFPDAAALPLAVSTAACALFQTDYLALAHPSHPAAAPTGETVLIWGASSSVGTNAVQLAAAAGYEVLAVASAKNHDYVRKLGAAATFDYRDASVADDIVKAFEGKTSAGAFAIGQDSAEKVAEIVSRISVGRKFVACANPPPERFPDGVDSKFVFGSDLKDNDVGPAIFEKFLPRALAEGAFVSSPPTEVVGHGLEAIQGGLDRLMQGVSLKKLVVTL